MTIPTDLLARLRAAIADAKDDGHAYAVATRADLAALLALVEAPAPLTVGAALADPRVQDGSHVVEYRLRADLGNGREWDQKRRVDDAWKWRPTRSGVWDPWWPCTAMSPDEACSPCRLVPLADADCDPNERGPL